MLLYWSDIKVNMRVVSTGISPKEAYSGRSTRVELVTARGWIVKEDVHRSLVFVCIVDEPFDTCQDSLGFCLEGDGARYCSPLSFVDVKGRQLVGGHLRIATRPDTVAQAQSGTRPGF
jgi:hypothetical protein